MTDKMIDQKRGHKWQSLFIRYLMVYGLFFLPFLFIHYQYIDDLDRTVTGVYGWSSESGRLLTDVLMWSINFGRGLLNIAPLPQILALIVMAGVSTQVFIRWQLKGVLEGACLLFLFLNPFFLENFSFIYDALSMTLANGVAMLAIPYFFSQGWRNVLVAFALSVCVFLLYQPAVNTLMILVAVFYFIESKTFFITPKYYLKMIRPVITVVLAGLVAMLIAAIFIKTGHGKHLELLVPLSMEGLSSIFSHLIRFFYVIIDSLREGPLQSFLWFFVLCACFLVFPLKKEDYKFAWYQYAFRLSFLIVLLVLSGGVLMVLRSPIYPYRALMGVGALLCAASMLAVKLIQSERIRQLLFYALMLTLFPLLIFTYIYTNVLNDQETFEREVVRTVIDKIGNNSKKMHSELRLIPGNIVSVRTQRALREWPFLYGLIENRLTNWWLTPILFKDAGITPEQLTLTVDKSGSAAYCFGKSVYASSQYDLFYYQQAYYLSAKKHCQDWKHP